jgi:hypothetical protein
MGSQIMNEIVLEKPDGGQIDVSLAKAVFNAITEVCKLPESEIKASLLREMTVAVACMANPPIMFDPSDPEAFQQ